MALTLQASCSRSFLLVSYRLGFLTFDVTFWSQARDMCSADGAGVSEGAALPGVVAAAC